MYKLDIPLKCDYSIRHKKDEADAKKKEALGKELQTIVGKCNDFRAMQQLKEKEERMQNMYDHVKKHLPNGVYGRITDILQPSRKDWTVALNVALSGYHDALFVDTPQTCKEAIEYLKRERIGTMTLIPTGSNGAHLNLFGRGQGMDRVWTIPGTKKALECCTWDTKLEKKCKPGFDFLLIDVIFVEDMDAAYRVKDKMREYKLERAGRIITKHGEQIRANGILRIIVTSKFSFWLDSESWMIILSCNKFWNLHLDRLCHCDSRLD